MSTIKKIFHLIMKILNYNICKLPSDLSKFSGTKTCSVVVFSFMYIFLIAVMLGLLFELGKRSIPLLITFYLLCSLLSSVIIKERPHFFCLDKYKNSSANLILLMLLGPFGMLKIAHLWLFLQLMVHTGRKIRLITINPKEIWYRKIKEQPMYGRDGENRFLESLAKYQKRLKDYS